MNPDLTQIVSCVLTTAGAMFFLAGTVGLLRFPDVYTRLHAIAKADNLGLGLVAVGLAVQTDSMYDALRLLIIWLLALMASATVSHLIGQAAQQAGVQPWREP